MSKHNGTHWSTRLFAAFLAFVMLLGNVPVNVFATEITGEEVQDTAVPETGVPGSGETEAEVAAETGSVHTHEYTSMVTAPTCAEQGYTTYTCECGDKYVADYVEVQDHTYKNGICTGCGSSVPDGNYTHAIPENQGVQNAIDRAYSLTDVEWTPLADVPGVKKINGEFTVVPFEAGKTYRGIPYSGVTANDCYVGLNVSLESFLTALKNKKSVLYTENLFSTNPKSATYFGTVCSKFAQYALDIPGSYNTNNIANIPGMETIALPGKYTVDQIKLGDVVLHTQNHTTVCTDILYDAEGNVAFIEISEAVQPLCRRMYWSPEEFYEHFEGYRLCRYQYIDQTPAIGETELTDDYALMPRFGDKYNYKVSSTKGTVDVLESGYHKAVILRDGVIIDEIVLGGATSFKFDRSVPGYLEMYLEKQNGTRSGSVYACVVKSSVTVTNTSLFTQGNLTVTIDGSCGTPVYVQVGSAHAIFCNVEGKSGTVEISFPFSKVSSKQVRVAYQNEYGIYLSDWSGFTTAPNTSQDAYLSQGGYWDGYTLTPSSHTPVVQSGKTGYWTYTMIPVEENATYYSKGCNRMWFLDAKGNPITTFNANTESDVRFQFTTPEGTAYVSITYAPSGVDKGTESIQHIHTYTDGTCTGCGEAQPGPVITKQPTDGKAKMGESFCVTVEAEGEGLKYQWYVKEAGTTTWIKSSITDNTYDSVMNAQRAGRQIYCVITDANGKSVTTDTVQLVLLPAEPTYIWDQWTQPVTMTAGTYPTYGGSSTGYYSKGQTFGGILYSSTIRDGRDVLWNLNSSTYYSAVANPASLLYTTDYRGRVFNESAWAGSVCNTTALKACGYAYPYTTTEIPMKFDEKTDHGIDNLEFGDILWTKGHVAGVIGVTTGNDGHVASVKIIEQASYVKVFEITAQNWDTYFSGHWTHIYRGDFDETKTAPEDYPENLSIIFERGNNTYVTDTSKMLFYIPTATTVYVTKDGVTASYAKDSFPTRTVIGVTVYDLASAVTGIGDYYFHTEENTTDICIKVINKGSITISGATATLSGYENCEILGYRVIQILDEAKSSSFNFFEAPEGYTSEAVPLTFRWYDGDTFEIENIPADAAGWKLEVYYDTGYGWARMLSSDIIYGEETHTHTYENGICTLCGAEMEAPVWEQGTIAYATGLNRDDTTRIRTAGYLKLEDYAAVTVNSGYMLVRFVYDQDYKLLSGTDWLGDGIGFSVDGLKAQFPKGVYFRVALCAKDNRVLTPDDVAASGITFLTEAPEIEMPLWEQGTIASVDGTNNSTTTRFRTADYHLLSDYSGVGINTGYTMTNFVYDENYTYLGTSSWLGSGIPFTTAALQEKYPTGVYFRVVFRADDQRNLTEADVAASGVKFYLPGEEIPTPEFNYSYENIASIGSWQDGAIWDGKLFALGAAGTGAVFDVKTGAKLGSIQLDGADVLKPHANSVCFGSTYYAAGDDYPLLYVNIYNNYASVADRMEGTCCVYQVTEKNNQFATELVQVIKIGFTEDLNLWKSKENNGDVRPYGNFVVDTDEDVLYAFVMRDANKTTRFFAFDIPTIGEGVYNESYGCNVVTLETGDIKNRFDIEHHKYLQGCSYHGGKILYVGDFGGDAPLLVVDLKSQKVTEVFSLGHLGLKAEPEVICADPADGTVYYAAADGMLRKLTLPVKFEAPKTFAGKTISILGDSISTYTGISNNASYNATLSGGAIYYTAGRLGVYQKDTWWQQAIDALGMELLVNNSWSGSCVFSTRSGTVGAYIDRAVQLHNIAGEEPDIVAVYLGTNDFGNYKSTLGTAAAIDYDRLITKDSGTYSYANPATAAEAYAIMLHKAMVRYPDAEFYCFTLLPQRNLSAANQTLMIQFNESIAAIAAHFGAYVVDLYNKAGIKADKNFQFYVADNSLHPGPAGMDAITGCFTSALYKNSSYAGDVVYDISYELTDVIVDQGTAYAIQRGDHFSCSFTAPAGYELTVSVTMGDEDITESVYADGKLVIEAVNGELNITACSKMPEKDPENYRWVFDGMDLSNVSAGMNAENTITRLSGSVTDGVHKGSRFQLSKDVVLYHDRPWAIEWKSEGTWTDATDGALLFAGATSSSTNDVPYLYRRHKSDFIALGVYTGGKYHNYGVALGSHGIDATAEHTYRLENHIEANGSNMVYLYVDGNKVGPMNHHWIGGTDQKETVDWVNGQDFVFSYMGTNPHAIGGCSIDYIQVWENGKPSFEGKTVSILGDSISTYAGISNNTSYNSTLGKNIGFYPVNDVTAQSQTWWQQVIDLLGMKLLVNNSSGGGRILSDEKLSIVTNGTFSSNPRNVAAYKERCVNLHNANGENPDVILVFLGTNDFSYHLDPDNCEICKTLAACTVCNGTNTCKTCVSNSGLSPSFCPQDLGTADIRENLIAQNQDGTYAYLTPETTCEAYAILLHKMQQKYPDAEIYCMGLLARRDPDYAGGYHDHGQPTAFNSEMKELVERFGATFIDLENCGISKDASVFDQYIYDKAVHPNAAGMDKITEAVVCAMLGGSVQTYEISANLTNATLEGVRLAVSGSAYTAKLTPDSGYTDLDVTVTMGGRDITESVYADGVITIPAVTGAVTITASAMERDPKNFRWEFDGIGLVSKGKDDNSLKKLAGSVTDGFFSNARYQLEDAIILRHDRPWILEWKGEGSGGFMLAREGKTNDGNKYFFHRSNNTLEAFGYWKQEESMNHNYGVSLQNVIDTGSHKYRLENRIGSDGTNMVYLIVDDRNEYRMDRLFFGGAAQGTTGDWISGKDFVFNHIGTTELPLTNYKLDYLQVWENGHTHIYESNITAPTCTEKGYTTHTCECGDSYVDSYVDALGHSYEERKCTVCGAVVSYQLVDGFDAVSSIQGGDSRLVDAHDTVSPLILENLTLFENCKITAVNLFVTGTVVDNDGTNANDPTIEDDEMYTFDLVVLDASSVKAGQHYTIKRTYTLTVLGSDVKKNAWNTFDVTHLGITVGKGETLGFGSSNSTLEIFYLSKCVTTKLRYYGHNTTTGDTTLRLRTGTNLPVGVEGYKIDCTHQYVASVTAPTCTEQGYTTYTCSTCGDVYVDFYVDATGHNWSNGICTFCGEGKKPYKRLTYFTVQVEADGKTYSDNAVLYLPANYTSDGEPVRLVIYCKQGASQITSSSNPIESVGFYNYLLSLGYAVLGVDGVPDAWRDELGICERAVGNPVAVQGTEKAYDYVIENYNIAADGCFISGYSQGGHYAQNVIDLTDIPILAAAEQSPVCSMQYHQWDLNASVTVNNVKYSKAARLNVARIYGFPAFATNAELLNLAYDNTLVEQYDPWVRNSENIYTGFVQKSNLWYLPEGTSVDDITMTHIAKCPVKIWCAEDDTAISADVMKVFVKAIQNAGGTAEISIAPSGGHGFFQKQTAVGSFTENGKTYNTLPIAVEIADWFAQYGGYEHIHTYENGICTGCGAKEPVSHIPGDITGDGELNNKDVTRLFKYLSGYDVEVDEAALDVNGDGEIDNKDLTRLFRYLSGHDVTIY